MKHDAKLKRTAANAMQAKCRKVMAADAHISNARMRVNADDRSVSLTESGKAADRVLLALTHEFQDMGDISAKANVTRPTTSKALNDLYRRALVEVRRTAFNSPSDWRLK